MKYAQILSLSLHHSYYSDQRCTDFLIEPTETTRHLLRSYRLLLRTSESGAQIYSQVDDTGAPFIVVPATVTLSFVLKLRDQAFHYRTDLTTINQQAAPLYTNVNVTVGTNGELGLTSAPNPAPWRPPGVFAQVDLQVPGQTAGAAPTVASFQISFTSKQVRWAYYCVTDMTVSATSLQVVDTSTDTTIAALAFSASNCTDLTQNPDATDPTAVQLASRYPTMRLVRMTSDQPIACREAPRPYLELHLNNERIAGPLANPSPFNVLRSDLLYQVIKYSTQLF